MKIRSKYCVSVISVFLFLNSLSAHAAIPKKAPTPKYNLNMRIGIKGSMPFSVNTVAKSGKKASVTEISSDGLTETFVELVPRKSIMNQKNGVMIDVKVTKTVRGNIKATEKAQIFAYENEEAEIRVGATGKGRESLSVAVLANPI